MKLNGQWTLYFAPEGQNRINSVLDLKKSSIQSVPCTVPGNVELDLSSAGILPKDLYMGENIKEAEKYEIYEWWYETEFTAPDSPDDEHKVSLHFGAVDCYAEYFLNGEEIGTSDNMFISHNFDVTDILKYGEINTLHVHIGSATIRSAELGYELNMTNYIGGLTPMGVNARKAPHCFGWDIMPRAVSAGIWRDVELRYEKKYDFRYLYFNLNDVKGENAAWVTMHYDIALPPEYIFDNITYKVKGVCGESTFEFEQTRSTGVGNIGVDLFNLKFWWPKHYGEPNMYDITVEAIASDGTVLATKKTRRGFKKVELDHSEIVENGGKFEFRINGVKIMAVGSNWVPMDVYHSRDKQRYAKALELADDVGCNILRCWGGNVYEDHEFFDFCDEHGIMVWQDFAMACHHYPQAEWFKAKLREEAEWVVKELRDHVSIILWSGDNEVDYLLAARKLDPVNNHLTREVLPEVIERHDPFIPYIPSSPYISTKVFEMSREGIERANLLPEHHLWGPRDYYKSDFFTRSKAYFVSEIGYHGCPSKKSIEKFIDPEYVWPYQNNKQWNLHSTDQFDRSHRTMLMHDQVKQMFGEVPTDMDDYCLASQISQAEAKKYFIERTRTKMNTMGGVIWWNLIDGWPQMSDAVVDYYYEKKLAYDYIKRSSKDFIVALDEMDNWGHDVVCCNSTLKAKEGKCTVYDIDTNEVVFEKNFTAASNSNTKLGKIRTMYSEKRMFIIKWQIDGKTDFNTYLCGYPVFSFGTYKKWLNKISETEKNL